MTAAVEGGAMRPRSATGTRAAEPAYGSAFKGSLGQGIAAECTFELTGFQRKRSLSGADRVYLGNTG
jgi:hypothetical protein